MQKEYDRKVRFQGLQRRHLRLQLCVIQGCYPHHNQRVNTPPLPKPHAWSDQRFQTYRLTQSLQIVLVALPRHPSRHTQHNATQYQGHTLVLSSRQRVQASYVQ